MVLNGKKEDLRSYSKEELKRMREICIEKLNETAGSYRESDGLLSAVKDDGVMGIRRLSGYANDRRYHQNRLNEIDKAIKEKDSPKAKIEEYKQVAGELLLEMRNGSPKKGLASQLSDLKAERFMWLSELAVQGLPADKEFSPNEIQGIQSTISLAESNMDHMAEFYASLLGVIKNAAKNSKQVIPNYERDVDDYSQLTALYEMSALENVKALETLRNKIKKGTYTAGKTPAKPTSKSRRGGDDHYESRLKTKDYGVGGLGE